MKKCLPESILIASLVILTGISASGDSTDHAKAVAALDSEYQAAVKIDDADTMDRISANDFVVVKGSGQIYTKVDLLNMAQPKRVRYEHQEDTNKTVRVWGDTAVVTAILWLKGVDQGNPFDWHVWFSDTYVRTSSGWRYVHGQVSLPLPETTR